MTNTIIPIIRERLEREGYSGLFVPGECACKIDDLAACGSAEPDKDGWINGCEPGHYHHDPKNPQDRHAWLVCRSKEPPKPEAFVLYAF